MCILDRKIKERGKIQSSVLLNQRTAENSLEISAKISSFVSSLLQGSCQVKYCILQLVSRDFNLDLPAYSI